MELPEFAGIPDHIARDVGRLQAGADELDRVDVAVEDAVLGVVSVTITLPGPWTVMVH